MQAVKQPGLRLSSIASSLDFLMPFQPRYSDLLNEQHFYRNPSILELANCPVHPVTLRQLANFGHKLTEKKLLSSANFVRTELPIRLALKVKELQELNFGIANNYHLNQVYQSYCYYVNAFRRAPVINSLEDNDRFCRFISHVLDYHLIILPHLMMGSLEVSVLKSLSQEKLDKFISSMIRSRISRRVIMEQHLSLSKSFQSQSNPVLVKPQNYIGEAFEHGSIYEHLRLTADVVRSFLQSIYPGLKMPELVIEGSDLKFEFLTSHLNYIFEEILRNAFKATISAMLKRNKTLSQEELVKLTPPAVVVQVVPRKDSIAIKFSDQGGGMPKDELSKVWSFGKSPELASQYLKNFYKMSRYDLPDRPPMRDHQFWNIGAGRADLEFRADEKKADSSTGERKDLDGVLGDLGRMESSKKVQKSTLLALAQRPFEYTLGISLPMCKVYTDYWNGTLEIYSVQGYGSDVYLTLGKIGTNHDKLQLDRA